MQHLWHWMEAVGAPILWLLRGLHGLVSSWLVVLLLLAFVFEPLALLALMASPGGWLVRRRKEQEKALEQRRPFLSPEEAERHAQAIAHRYRNRSWLTAATFLMLLVSVGVRLYGVVGLLCALLTAPELRGQRLLWIPDMTARDPYYVLALLALLGGLRRLVEALRQGPSGGSRVRRLLGSLLRLLAICGLAAVAPAGVPFYLLATVLAGTLFPVVLAVVMAPLALIYKKLFGR